MIEERAKRALEMATEKYCSYTDEAEAAKQSTNVLRQHTMEDAAHTYLMLAENLYYVLTGEVSDKIEEIKGYIIA